jgi:hypothetical protein
MTRLWVLAPVALIMIANGCFGGSTASPASSAPTRGLSSGLVPRPYAEFQIHGTYTTGSSTNHSDRDLHRARFTITCNSEHAYRELEGGVLSWEDNLCIAILDYRTQIRLLGVECNCPLSLVAVDVRGTIRGRPVHERITPCLCGDGPQAAGDARVILKTQPPV